MKGSELHIHVTELGVKVFCLINMTEVYAVIVFDGQKHSLKGLCELAKG